MFDSVRKVFYSCITMLFKGSDLKCSELAVLTVNIASWDWSRMVATLVLSILWEQGELARLTLRRFTTPILRNPTISSHPCQLRSDFWPILYTQAQSVDTHHSLETIFFRTIRSLPGLYWSLKRILFWIHWFFSTTCLLSSFSATSNHPIY